MDRFHLHVECSNFLKACMISVSRQSNEDFEKTLRELMSRGAKVN